MVDVFLAFLFALVATLGFCILFHVPKRHIPPACFIGAVGWLSFEFFLYLGNDKAFSCFGAACLVALLSDLCSRIFKETATVFVIPGILPLVPGASAYYTMLSILEGDLEQTLSAGTETAFIACAIALALMAMASVIRVIVFVYRRFTVK